MSSTAEDGAKPTCRGLMERGKQNEPGSFNRRANARGDKSGVRAEHDALWRVGKEQQRSRKGGQGWKTLRNGKDLLGDTSDLPMDHCF